IASIGPHSGPGIRCPAGRAWFRWSSLSRPVDNSCAARAEPLTLDLMRSALALAAATVTVAVLLSGCVQQGPEVTPPPEPSTTPIFASDEEALAAATEAYEAYLAMSDLIAQEGGVNPERIESVAVRKALADALEGFSVFREQ